MSPAAQLLLSQTVAYAEAALTKHFVFNSWLPGPRQIFRRDLFRQPDAVNGTVEGAAVRSHFPGMHLVDPGLSVPCADLERHFIIP